MGVLSKSGNNFSNSYVCFMPHEIKCFIIFISSSSCRALTAGMGLGETMGVLVGGMSGNANTALS